MAKSSQELPPFESEFLQALGAIVIAWAVVEQLTAHLFIAMTEGTAGAMYVVTENTSHRSMTGWIRTLLDILETPPDIAEKMRNVLTDIEELGAERNAMVHGLWVMHPQPGSVEIQTLKLERQYIITSETVTLADLNDVLARIVKAGRELKEILAARADSI